MFGRCLLCGDIPCVFAPIPENEYVGDVEYLPLDGSGLCSQCVLEAHAPMVCENCHQPSCQSLCFECQCTLHALGAYDMDAVVGY